MIEQAVAGQFQAFLDEANCLDPIDSGFRPGYGTEKVLAALNHLYQEMD